MKKSLSTIFALLVCATLFSQNISLDPFANGFSSPIELKNAGDDRLFVVEQGGRIKILNSDGTTNTTPFLDISGLISSGSERGLLGLAFHPNYASNGYFYVNYTKAGGDTKVSRFTVSTGDPDVADPNSELPIIEYEQPYSNHNGGCVAFGPDGYLYISAGDGGSGGDPENRSQNTSTLLGKLLRIDVDNPANGNEYGIPTDNPFAGSTSNRQEIWAYGLRNAWKFSFDSANGDIWIADVGQSAREEINKAGGSEAGLNYGWRCYEGNIPYNTTGCPNMSELTFPVGEYNHSVGFSITGGYVYRGTTYSNIEGYYFFADFGSGLIGTIAPDGTQTINTSLGGSWAAFGQDVNGEMYLVNYSGAISKLVGEILSVDDFDANNISIYPNPAKNEVNIELINGTINAVSIMDLKGSVLFSSENISASSKLISTESLAVGIYLVSIENTDGTISVKKLLKN